MKEFDQNYSKKIGILITNLGTPDNPDKKSLRRYLKQFLSDRRVVDYNPILWKIILYPQVVAQSATLVVLGAND